MKPCPECLGPLPETPEERLAFFGTDDRLGCATHSRVWFEVANEIIVERVRATNRQIQEASVEPDFIASGMTAAREEKDERVGMGPCPKCGSDSFQTQRTLAYVPLDGGDRILAHCGECDYRWTEPCRDMPAGIEVGLLLANVEAELAEVRRDLFRARILVGDLVEQFGGEKSEHVNIRRAVRWLRQYEVTKATPEGRVIFEAPETKGDEA